MLYPLYLCFAVIKYCLRVYWALGCAHWASDCIVRNSVNVVGKFVEVDQDLSRLKTSGIAWRES